MSERFDPGPEVPEEHEPTVVKIEPFTEGGFQFLRRALGVALADPHGEVVIKTGGLLITYVHRPENTTFWDGVTNVQGDDSGALEGFKEPATAYDVQQGLRELDELKS